MDANGLRFWSLADEAHWNCGPDADYDPARRRLRLRSGRNRALPADLNLNGADAEARAALEIPPQARDLFGSRTYWDPARRALGATGILPGAARLRTIAPGADPDDVVLGYDGTLYLTLGGRVLLHDPRGRWADVDLAVPGFTAWRLAADPGGGAWVLDRVSQRLGHVHGMPLPARPFAPFTPCTVRPCEENADPPTLVVLTKAAWTASVAVALACAPDGRLAVLGWRDGDDALLHLQRPEGGLDLVVRLSGIRFPYTLAWLSNDTIATRVTRLPREALVFEIQDALSPTARAGTTFDPVTDGFAPSGDIYPLRDPVVGPFAHTLDLPPYYPTPADPIPLHRLSAPAYASVGTADGRLPLDSGSTETTWHRLYLEALLPPHCGIRVYLAASNQPEPPGSPADRPDDWHEHRFGDTPGEPQGAGPIARGVWVSAPSEIPFHEGLLGCPLRPGWAGLFTALIQRTNRRVRALRGRYLWAHVELFGDGRATPEVAALRAYGSRFSYVERYLPAFYREDLYGKERDEVLPAGQRGAVTRADFLERLVCNFEGVLTMLEDRIASAHLLTDPRTVPEASLEWLASWIGVSMDPAWSPARRRELLRATPLLYRSRGTLAGLAHALDLATGGRLEGERVEGGAVTGGEVVILENWRLRRTFATILGADLSDEDDPLLAGLAVSGNSFVGDTLFLGEEHRKEFLALFSADLPLLPAEREAVAEFFDRLAHRITVLVHQEVSPQDLGLIRRIVETEKPAHVAAVVARARYPFLVGVASLVGTDTYLRAPERRRPVELNRSLLGVRDYLLGLPSLDPRLARAGSGELLGTGQRPTAVLRAPAVVLPNTSFELDGQESHAAPGRRITRYLWRLLV